MARQQLPYEVQCRREGAAFFETIAAFDCAPAAFCYRDGCREAHPNFDYQVTKNGRIEMERV